MAAAAAAAAAEIERACKEAGAIVATLLTTRDIELLSKLSFGEAYALLWQDKEEGTISYKYSQDDIKARLCAAHVIDLLLAGRVKVYWASKRKHKFMQAECQQLRLMVSSTEAVGVQATSSFLQYLHVVQNDRLQKGKNPIRLVKLFEDQVMWKGPRNNTFDLEKETFSGLVNRGILTKEKQKHWVFFQTTIYPTSDPTPEAMLVQDLRAVLKQEIPSTIHFELLLKLVAKACKVFTAAEEAEDEQMKTVRKGFKHDAAFTLLQTLPTKLDESSVESPFTPNQELSVRLLVDTAEVA